MSNLLCNISTLARCKDEGGQDQLHLIENAAVAWEAGKITWIGAESDIPAELKTTRKIDAKGQVVVPGLIDCHTHLAFGGWRADEFEQRVRGSSYLDIAKAGGGILSTVQATRAATKEVLIEKASSFLTQYAKLGVTSVECKSGYGLDLETELKLLEVYQELRRSTPFTIVSTFLGAHTIPNEHKAERAAYISKVVNEMLPAVAEQNLASFCDVFVEDSAFSIDEARSILLAAAKLGLKAKLHADQLTSSQGAELAAEVGAISADHLEQISETGISQMAKAGVIAVTLPLASLYTQQAPLDARPLIGNGVKVAVASDFNPGSAPSAHLPLAMMLSCNLNRLTPAEVLKGATVYAAKAIGMEDKIGSIEIGKSADFAILETPSINHWLYNFQANNCTATIKAGELIHGEFN